MLPPEVTRLLPADMDFTMLQKLCQRGRLQATLHDNQFTNPTFHEFSEILSPKDKAESEVLSEKSLANILAKAKPLENYQYQALLHYLNSNGQTWKAFNELPPPTDRARILSPQVVMLHQVKFDERIYSCRTSHEANSAIAFYNPYYAGLQVTGFIEAIWQIPLHYIMQTFLLVQVHQDLSDPDNNLAPLTAYPRLASKLVDVQPSDKFLIIEPRHIIVHLSMFRHPKGTFGIQKEIRSVCWSLNRGRK